MSDTLRQRAERLMAMESNASKGEWCALVRELLTEMESLDLDLQLMERSGCKGRRHGPKCRGALHATNDNL